MKIKLILTGGTIGSVPDDEGVIDTNQDNAVNILLDHYFTCEPEQRKKIEFDISSPIDLLSENLSLTHWNELISHFQNIKADEYDGIIMSHGTDTLAFTTNLLSILLDGLDMPVFIVSSSKPLTNKDANGFNNFVKAVNLIKKGIDPGVYVPYKNKDKQVEVHKAGNLTQSADLSPDFHSAHHKLNDTDKISEELKIIHKGIDTDIPLLYSIKEMRGNILTIAPHPGLNYNNYNLESVDAVLHRTYHSSTVSIGDKKKTDSRETFENDYSIFSLKERCDEKSIPLYVTPVLSNSNKVYSSTDQIIKRGIIPLFDMTFEMSYVYLLLKYSLFV